MRFKWKAYVIKFLLFVWFYLVLVSLRYYFLTYAVRFYINVMGEV